MQNNSKNIIQETFIKGKNLICIGIDEWGLDKETSLIIIDLFYKFMIPILGGDVYFDNEDCNKIKPNYDSWYYEKDENDDVKSYTIKSLEKAREYIINYPKQNVLFTITFDRDLVLITRLK